jgi:hypothetical protein
MIKFIVIRHRWPWSWLATLAQLAAEVDAARSSTTSRYARFLDKRLAARRPELSADQRSGRFSLGCATISSSANGGQAHGRHAVAGRRRCLARVHPVHPPIRQVLPGAFRPLPAPHTGRGNECADAGQRRHEARLAAGLRTREDRSRRRRIACPSCLRWMPSAGHCRRLRLSPGLHGGPDGRRVMAIAPATSAAAAAGLFRRCREQFGQRGTAVATAGVVAAETKPAGRIVEPRPGCALHSWPGRAPSRQTGSAHPASCRDRVGCNTGRGGEAQVKITELAPGCRRSSGASVRPDQQRSPGACAASEQQIPRPHSGKKRPPDEYLARSVSTRRS